MGDSLRSSRSGRPAAVALALITLLVSGGCGGGDDEPPEGSREVSIASGGAELPATVMGDANRSGDETTAVVISHGANGRRDDFYEIEAAFAAAGFFTVAYDARSDHRVEDLDAVVAWARAEGAGDIVLLGGSYGACVSVTRAVALDAIAVIGLSTAPSCGADAVAAAQAPEFAGIAARFVVAEGDEGFVPTANALATATDTEVIVADGDAHGSGVTDEHPEIIDQLVAFLADGTR